MLSVKLCTLQNYLECKIIQSEKLCRVQNYALCQIMQSAKLCRGAQLGKMQNYVKCDSGKKCIGQQQSAFVQLAHPQAFGAC